MNINLSKYAGASIFVPENRILVQAVRDFGLEMSRLRIVHDDDDDDVGMLFLALQRLTLVGMAPNSYTLRIASLITTGILSSLFESMEWLRSR